MQQAQLLLHRRLHRLPRTPPQMILPAQPPSSLRRNRIRAATNPILDIALLIAVLIVILDIATIEIQLRQVRRMDAKVASREAMHRQTATTAIGSGPGTLGRHLLARLGMVPVLAGSLPADKGVRVADDGGGVEEMGVESVADEGVHVEGTGAGALAQEGQDVLDPAHELVEEAVVVAVDLVDELVKVVLVAGAQVDEGLDGLVGVGGDVLALGGFDDGDGVVGEEGEVGDGGVDVGGFVHAYERFVEDGEEVAEELEGVGLEVKWR